MAWPCAIVVQGGAINPVDGEFGAGIAAVAEWGMGELRAGGSALDVVERTVNLIEDNPLFNCGTGARLNMVGDAELDACIMDGSTLKSGAVASIRQVRHPVSVARKVMETTDHVLLVGTGAEKFARAMGFEPYDPVTEFRREEWRDLTGRLRRGEELPPNYAGILNYWSKMKDWLDDDTVGVIARDRFGNIAAGTSSGGGPLKLPGRVGDVPCIGCGIYADRRAGAAVLTGHGEIIMRHLAAKEARDLMKEGQGAQEAAESIVRLINREAPGARIAIITLDATGGVGGARNVETTPHAYLTEDMAAPAGNFMPMIHGA